MLSYQDYEKAVYDALMAKRNTDRRFNFSVRQKASKGAERDLFIGTANSLYFGTTFWQINVGYPGSAGDLINLFFFYLDEDKLGYYFQFTQTTTPHNSQNSSALELIKSIESEIKDKIGLITESKAGQKIFMFKTKSRKQAYLTVGEMMKDVFEDAEIIMPIVNKQIEKIKKVNPKFIAHQFTDQEFDKFQEKLKRRLGSKIEISTSESNEHKIHEFKMKSSTDCPLNQILFGPPGTGKTYHTVNEALKIVGVETAGLTREKIKEAFDAKVKEGQIVFTTFHQSLSYEDFIEGIKPIEPEKEEGQVIYRVEPGIFKKLCIEASFDIAKVGMSQETAVALDFSNLYDLFIEEVEEKLSNQKDVKLKTKSEGTVLIDSISQPGNIIIKHPKGERTYTVSKARLTKLNSSIKDLDEVSNINDEFRSIIGGSNSSAYWAVLNGIRQITKRVAGKLEDKTYTYSDKVEVVNQMTKDDYNAIGSRRFVVIIDEINRGNVSQIFGELITLIEEDKRLGRDEALEVTLPYSKEKFGVPANLYLIGTMNTADRSVEALDTALRRRFSFTEMPPKYELDGLNYSFAGITGSELLKTINKRIEKLLDRDHLIGHSYFLMEDEDKTEPGEKLRNSFYRNIIPLLQEYFFGDYAKIGAVLGRGFVRAINGEENEDSFFSAFEGFEPSDYQDKISYQLIVYQDLNGKEKIQIKDNSEEADFKRAIEILMNR